MDKKKIRKQLDSYLEKVIEEFDPERVALFGSFIRDDFDEESDVDVIVVAENFKKMNLNKRLDKLIKLEVENGIISDAPFQIWPITQEELDNDTFPTITFSQPTWVDIYQKR